jgi:hypothetical protein
VSETEQRDYQTWTRCDRCKGGNQSLATTAAAVESASQATPLATTSETASTSATAAIFSTERPKPTAAFANPTASLRAAPTASARQHRTMLERLRVPLVQLRHGIGAFEWNL